MQFVNQSDMPNFIQGFMRYQGITLEFQGLCRKHLETHD